MSENRLKVAVVGLGVGEQHALAYINNPHTSLSVLVDLNKQKAEEVKSKYNMDECNVMSFENMLRSDVDIVSIASFDDAHASQVIAAVKAGKHVFVEKPLCTTYKELKAIKSVLKSRNLALSSNLVLRKAPLYQRVIEHIKNGDFGDIYSIDADYLYGRMHKITEGWRSTAEDYSIMEGGGIHVADLMLAIAQENPKAVYSEANKIVTRQTAFKYHDYHSAQYSFSSGLIARITANFGCVHKHEHVLRVFGTKATFINDDMGARIHWGRDENQNVETLSLSDREESKGVLIDDFVENIRNETMSDLAKREFDLMAIVLAADAALGYKEPLKIKYVT